MMITFSDVLSWTFQLLFPPFLVILLTTLVLASIGKSLGIRRLYVKTLIRVFEFAGKLLTASVESDKEEADLGGKFEIGDSEESGHESEDNAEDETDFKNNGGIITGTTEEEVAYMREKLRKIGRESRHNVISRKDNLILIPDRAPAIPEEDVTANIAEEKGVVGGGGGANHGNESGLSGNDSAMNPATPDSDTAHQELADRILSGREVSAATFQREFELDDVLAYVKTGIASIIEDEVTQRFVSEELKCWNLLSRTSQSFEFVNVKLTVMWIAGTIIRYVFLLPGRFLILLVGFLWMAVCMTLIGRLREGPLKQKLYYYAYTTCFQILGGSLSAVITYHQPQNKPKNGICVANHTSPIDVLILACDNAYDLIGQIHGGVIGNFQNVLSKCSSHIWFERSESKDRLQVQKKLKEHVEDPDKLPILIFPEGTCINNTSVMQFKKGSFEVGGIIYPVAIKYDPLFGDAFWNSSKYGMMTYILMMMTSWAIVCDVWYLPPMVKNEQEDAITFANRVKAEIARQGGLVDLMWDGNLKRSSVKPAWKAIQQQAFSATLQQRLKVE